ncbi:MAG: hypothetical protein WCJ34_16775, partial [Alcaligenaceae bacterium]
MKYTTARSLIAGFGLTLVAAGTLAQPSVSQPTSATAASPSTAQVAPHGNMQGNMHGQPHAANKEGVEGPMGQIPQAVLDQLALTPAQKVQFDAAQAARKELQASKQSLRAEQQKVMSEELAKDTIDPRTMMAQQKKMRTTMESKMEAVQQKWLAFWDGLSAPQKT